MKNWEEPKVEFVVKSKWNQLNEKEKEIQKLFHSGNNDWMFLLKTLFKYPLNCKKKNKTLQIHNFFKFNQIKSHTIIIHTDYVFKSNQIKFRVLLNKFHFQIFHIWKELIGKQKGLTFFVAGWCLLFLSISFYFILFYFILFLRETFF